MAPAPLSQQRLDQSRHPYPAAAREDAGLPPWTPVYQRLSVQPGGLVSATRTGASWSAWPAQSCCPARTTDIGMSWVPPPLVLHGLHQGVWSPFLCCPSMLTQGKSETVEGSPQHPGGEPRPDPGSFPKLDTSWGQGHVCLSSSWGRPGSHPSRQRSGPLPRMALQVPPTGPPTLPGCSCPDHQVLSRGLWADGEDAGKTEVAR